MPTPYLVSDNQGRKIDSGMYVPGARSIVLEKLARDISRDGFNAKVVGRTIFVLIEDRVVDTYFFNEK